MDISYIFRGSFFGTKVVGEGRFVKVVLRVWNNGVCEPRTCKAEPTYMAAQCQANS